MDFCVFFRPKFLCEQSGLAHTMESVRWGSPAEHAGRQAWHGTAGPPLNPASHALRMMNASCTVLKSATTAHYRRTGLHFWLAVSLAFATALVYSSSLWHNFVNYDDYNYVTTNNHVLTGLTAPNIAWAFSTLDLANWHPLTWLTLQLDASLGGGKPVAFHATNVFLHATTSALLFWLLARTTGSTWLSLIAACLFAWHPLRVESVAWVAERKDVLSGQFAVLALWAYTHYVRAPGRLKLGGVAGLLVLGLMAKPMLVTLPLLMLLMDYWPLRRREPFPVLVREKKPLFLLVAVSSGITLYAQWAGGSVRSLENVPLSNRVDNAVVSTAEYCRKLFWPSDLAVFYPHRSHSALALGFCATALAAMTIFIVWQYRGRPYLTVGWLWFLVMLGPVCGLVQVGDQALADRYTYLPSIGLSIALVWGLGDLVSHPWTLKASGLCGAATILLFCILLTQRQLRYWRDSTALWRHAIAVGDANVLAYQKLGMAYLDQGDRAEAIKNFEIALKLDPKDPTTLCNLGAAYAQANSADVGIRYLKRATELDPRNVDAWYNLGVLASKHHRPDSAQTYYERALVIRSDFWPAHLNLGLDALAQSEPARAVSHLRRAAAINPLSAEAVCFLGVAHESLGQTSEARHCYQSAARMNPSLAIAMEKLAHLEAGETLTNRTK
jgi:tetratricopeptide (TPR) repeat protein